MVAKNFDEAIAYVNTINRVWTLRNYEQPQNKARFLCSWSYAIVIVILNASSLILGDLFVVHQLSSNKESIVYLYMTFVYILANICMMVLSLYHSKNALTYKKDIYMADERFKKLGLTFNYQHMFVRVAVLACLWWIHMIVTIGYFMKCLWNNSKTLFVFFNVVNYVFGNNIGSNILFDFKINLFWLGVRFKQLNKLLSSIIVKDRQTEPDAKTISGSFRNSYKSKAFPENRVLGIEYEPRYIITKLQEIRSMHLHLCCMSKRLNKIFGAQIMIYSLSVSVYFTIICYYIYDHIRGSRAILQFKTNILLMMLLDVLFSIVKLVIVSYNAEYTMRQANKIAKIVHEFSLYEADAQLKEEILQFSFQISQQGNSKATLFGLNFTFLRECVAFVTTSLVIIIQWKQNSDLDEENVANVTDIIH